MLNSKSMKQIIKFYIALCTILIFLGGCDKDFVEINTNPYAITEVDPALVFAGAQRSHLGNWAAEHTIVQQFVNPYNQGATLGFNFNEDIDGVGTPKWNESYTGPVRNLVHAIDLLGADTGLLNLPSKIRLWTAKIFMNLVYTYDNLPYFQTRNSVSHFISYPVSADDAFI